MEEYRPINWIETPKQETYEEFRRSLESLEVFGYKVVQVFRCNNGEVIIIGERLSGTREQVDEWNRVMVNHLH